MCIERTSMSPLAAAGVAQHKANETSLYNDSLSSVGDLKEGAKPSDAFCTPTVIFYMYLSSNSMSSLFLPLAVWPGRGWRL